MRAWFSGKTLAFQAKDAGSIPAARLDMYSDSLIVIGGILMSSRQITCRRDKLSVVQVVVTN